MRWRPTSSRARSRGVLTIDRQRRRQPRLGHRVAGRTGTDRERTQQQIQAELQKKLHGIAGLPISLRSANSLGIRGGGQGLRFAIAGPDYARLPTPRSS